MRFYRGGHMNDITYKLQDLRELDWVESVNTSGTGGTFLKARKGTGNSAVYYKLSCSDEYRGIYGHECVNEIIACRLMDVLGIEHLAYRLVHALVSIEGVEYETWLAKSVSFRHAGEKKQALDTFCSINRNAGELPFDFCRRMGWGDYIERMMLVDYLIANRDRHGANIEVLRAQDGSVRLAPLFDNGLSLIFSCYGDEERAARFDPLTDVNANNFIGSRSLEANLGLFNVHPAVRPLVETDRTKILHGLDGILSPTHLNKIWQMIWERWLHYESLRNR